MSDESAKLRARVEDAADFLITTIYPEDEEGPDPRLPHDVVRGLAKAVGALREAHASLAVVGGTVRSEERARQCLGEARAALEKYDVDAPYFPPRVRWAIQAAYDVATAPVSAPPRGVRRGGKRQRA